MLKTNTLLNVSETLHYIKLNYTISLEQIIIQIRKHKSNQQDP